MAEASNTDAIRNMAPKWTLAGDDKLLDLLQKTHQNILTKCQEVNSKLEEMSLALVDTSINLQNVNNKFMALSNSQFIESRVYDDDAELSMDEQTNKLADRVGPEPDLLAVLKSSVAVLADAHDTAEIHDSDSDCSDDEISVVLKPKDMYNHRPLPYIIGSQQWRSKWHAGLIVEDSDSDSTTSRPERDGDIEQYYYSSESDDDRPVNNVANDQTLSESSDPSVSDQPRAKPSPAEVAAELARKLAPPHPVVQKEPEIYVPPMTKVYQPDRPVTGTIFSDEPPPLENCSESSASEDEDIFAEITKNKPYNQRKTIQTDIADDLFGVNRPREVEIFSEIVSDDSTPNPVNEKPSLFDKEIEADSFAEPDNENANNYNNVDKEEISSKKPVGGISLFGSNKGAESIGAAILKRNQRKTSSSDDESVTDRQTKVVQEKTNIAPKITEKDTDKVVDEVDKMVSKKEKDIFEDLFAKTAEKKPQKLEKVVKEKGKDNAKEKKNIKDLFSDDMFDDIDDIFTSNVSKHSKAESKQKSIFDDEDELFSEVAAPKIQINQSTSKNDKKNIFDSDDDLFSDVKPKNEPTEESQQKLNKHFTVLKETKIDSSPNVIEDSPNVGKTLARNDFNRVDFVKPTDITKERNLFDDSPQNIPKTTHLKAKSIFDSDSDDDIFANIKTSDEKPETSKPLEEDKTLLKVDQKPSVTFEEKPTILSPSLFDDDDDELFTNNNKSQKVNDQTVESKVNIRNENDQISEDIENDLLIDKHLVENVEQLDKVKEVTIISHEDDLTSDSPFKDENTQKSIIVDSTLTKEDSFDDNSFEDELFSIPKESTLSKNAEENIPEVIESSQGIESGVDVKIDPKPEPIRTEIEHKIKVPDVPATETILKESAPEVKSPDNLKESLMAAIQIPISNDFDDIFSEPPEFEKAADTKKTKNVNALFDDDSDDEALFFKNDDVVTDEKPAIFSNNTNFDIFVDEPPDLDVDFIEKSSKSVHFEDDIFSSTSNLPESNFKKTPDAKSSEILTANDAKSSTSVEISSNHDSNISIQDMLEAAEKDSKNDSVDFTSNKIAGIINEDDFDNDLFGAPQVPEVRATSPPESIKKAESDDELFSNIPKSSQNKEQDDLKQELVNKSQAKELETSNEPDTVINESKRDETKRIGKLNTKNFNINVNALMPGASPKKIKEIKQETQAVTESKAQILPKTENSNKLEEIINSVENEIKFDSKPIKPVTFESKPDAEILDNNVSKQRARIQVKRRPSTRRARHEAARKSGIDFGGDTDNSNSNDSPVRNTNVPVLDVDTEKDSCNLEIDLRSQPKKSLVSNEKLDEVETKKSTTKIVYILNDEDIFNTDTNKNTKDVSEPNIPDLINTQPIKTLGNTYKEDVKEVTKEEPKRSEKSKLESLFDDSDEELFKSNKKVEKKANIFDSDSEEDLFSGKKRKEKKNEEKKKEVIVKKLKESLFSDDDDDDLFGVKKDTSGSNQVMRPDTSAPSTSLQTASKTTQPVFDDPLSLLGED